MTRQILGKLIRLHPRLHETAVRAYMPIERRVGRIRRARMLTEHQQTVRDVLTPRVRGKRGAGPKVLFISTRGYNFHQLVDGVISHGLQLRGAQCEFFTCGGGMSLCDLSFEHLGLTPKHCDYCTDCSVKTINAFGYKKPHTLRGLLGDAEIAAWTAREQELLTTAAEYVYKGVPVGEMVDLSLRYILLRSNLPDTDEIRSYRARMVVSACMLVDAYERLFDRVKPDRLFIFNGLGFPEKVVRFMADRQGIAYTTYECGVRPGTLCLAHQTVAAWMEVPDAYWEQFKDVPLTPEQDRQLDEQIAKRCSGTGGIEIYWPSMETDQTEIRRQLDIPEGARVVTLFSNMICDTAVLDRDRTFPTMMDWIKDTIEYFGKHRPNDILCLRIHPVEARCWIPSNERVGDELENLELPPNLRVIAADQVISSYELMRMSEVGLAYTSTTGMEMALLGRNVICCGITHYDKKGFTHSPDTPEKYFRLLAPDALPPRLNHEQYELARRYAYTFWFRQLMEFPFVTIPAPAQPLLHLEQPQKMDPGAHPEFDLLCDAIIRGVDPLELRRLTEQSAALAPSLTPVPQPA